MQKKLITMTEYQQKRKETFIGLDSFEGNINWCQEEKQAENMYDTVCDVLKNNEKYAQFEASLLDRWKKK